MNDNKTNALDAYQSPNRKYGVSAHSQPTTLPATVEAKRLRELVKDAMVYVTDYYLKVPRKILAVYGLSAIEDSEYFKKSKSAQARHDKIISEAKNEVDIVAIYDTEKTRCVEKMLYMWMYILNSGLWAKYCEHTSSVLMTPNDVSSRKKYAMQMVLLWGRDYIEDYNNRVENGQHFPSKTQEWFNTFSNWMQAHFPQHKDSVFLSLPNAAELVNSFDVEAMEPITHIEEKCENVVEEQDDEPDDDLTKLIKSIGV